MKSTRSSLPLAILVLFSACRGVTGLGDLSFSDETTTTSASGSGGAAICEPGATEVCAGAYSGPPGTEGVGICRAPTRACSADGSGYGACAGEVLPQVEDCATPAEDESCDGKPACDGAALWAIPFGEGSSVNVCGAAADIAGNVFVAGDFSGDPIDLGGGLLDGGDAQRLFVAKLDPTGAHLWSKVLKGASEERCMGMTVDGDGNVILAGYYGGGQPDFGGGPLPLASLYDGFIAKLDGQGAHVFSQAMTGLGDQSVWDVAVDGSGTAFVVGRFQETVKIGPFTLTAEVQNEAFVAKFSPDGTPVFAERYSATGLLHGLDIAVDSSTGDAVFSGQIVGTGQFGGATLNGASGNYDSFIARLSAGGSIAWALSLGGANSQEVTSLAFDREGGVLVAGQFESAVDFGNGIMLSSNSKDGFVMRLDAMGVTSWAKAVTGPSEQTVTSVAVDGAGNAVISGRFNTAIVLDDNDELSVGGYDLYLAKLDALTGSAVWLRSRGGAVNEVAWTVAGDAQGNTLTMGKYDGDLDFGLASGPLLDASGNAFIAKLAP